MARSVCLPLPADPGDPDSLAALLHRYLIWMETHHFAAQTVKIRRLQLSRFLLWCDDRSITQAREVTPEMIERFQRHLFYYRKRDGQPLCRSSQSHSLTSRARLVALDQGPAGDRAQSGGRDPVAPPGEAVAPARALGAAKWRRCSSVPDLATPVGLRNRAVLETLYSTGLRRAEALALELGDLDRERGVLLVRQGKGHKDRFVPIGQRALGWIDQYLREARPRLTDDPRQGLLFVTRTGRRMHPNQLSGLVRHLLREAGIAKAGACHLFRHAVATLMLHGGADIRYIQALLGHESLATTQVYAHVAIGKLCEVHARTHPAELARVPEPDPDPAAASTGHDLPDDDDDPDFPWVPTA